MDPIIRRILLVGAIIIGGFLTLRLMNLLMAWSLYSWFFQTIGNASGMPDTLNGAVSIWLVAITLMLLPTFFSVIFWKRDPRKVLLIMTAVSAWLVIVYFMSLPREGRFFNPMTSHAMYRYARTPDGKIDLFPLGYNYHPRYQTKLEFVTPEIIAEIDRIGTGKVESETFVQTNRAETFPSVPQGTSRLGKVMLVLMFIGLAVAIFVIEMLLVALFTKVFTKQDPWRIPPEYVYFGAVIVAIMVTSVVAYCYFDPARTSHATLTPQHATARSELP